MKKNERVFRLNEKTKNWKNFSPKVYFQTTSAKLILVWVILCIITLIVQERNYKVPTVIPFALGEIQVISLTTLTIILMSSKLKMRRYAAWASLSTPIWLVLSRPTADDAYYVNITQAISESGYISKKDTIQSNEVFMDFFPERDFQLWEKFWGVVARILNAEGTSVVYFFVGPIVSFLAFYFLFSVLTIESERKSIRLPILGTLLVLFSDLLIFSNNIPITNSWHAKFICQFFLLTWANNQFLKFLDSGKYKYILQISIVTVISFTLSYRAIYYFAQFIAILLMLLTIKRMMLVQSIWRKTMLVSVAIIFYVIPYATGMNRVLSDLNWLVLPRNYIGRINHSVIVLILAVFLIYRLYPTFSSGTRRLLNANLLLLFVEFSPLFNLAVEKIIGRTLIELSGWALFVFPGLQLLRYLRNDSFLRVNKSGEKGVRDYLDEHFRLKYLKRITLVTAVGLLVMSANPKLLFDDFKIPLQPPLVQQNIGAVRYLTALDFEKVAIIVPGTLAIDLVKIKPRINLQIPPLLTDLREENYVPRHYMTTQEILRRQKLLGLTGAGSLQKMGLTELGLILRRNPVVLCRTGPIPPQQISILKVKALIKPKDVPFHCYRFNSLSDT